MYRHRNKAYHINYVSINQAVDAIEKSGILTFDELKAIIYKGTKWDTTD